MNARVMVCCLSVLWVCPAVYALPFIYPPEDPVWGAPEWETGFPYQRNIMWDFDRDPSNTPPAGQYNDPAYDVHYEGTDDPNLWESDWVTFAGDVEWFETLGRIGIDNTGGCTELEGSVTFHIDNWPDPQLLKHVWTEIESLQPMPFQNCVVPTWGDIPGLLPPGYTEVDSDWWLEYDGVNPEVLENDWIWIEPNPPWEEIRLDIYAPAGEAVYVDSVHIATECVPEPATVVLLALGGLPMLVPRRRRK